MSSGNRVEELESRVRELEATISGLTDELVESRERLHALEEEVDPDMDIIEGRPTRTRTDEESEEPVDAEAEEAKSGEDDAPDEADSKSSDDIIVA